jgi:hypothetical protein
LPSIACSERSARSAKTRHFATKLTPPDDDQPGSLRYGSSHKINDWIEIKTWRRVDFPAIQPGPDHVPSKLRQTFYIDQPGSTSFRETHPVGVEVRVISIFPAIRRHAGNIRSDGVVAVWQVDVEDETTILVRSSFRTDYHCLHDQLLLAWGADPPSDNLGESSLL